MASAYRSYAHHHPGRYSAFTRMPLGGDDPEFTDATRAAAAPVIAVLASYGLDGENAFYAALEFWSAMHGFVLLEMTGAMNGIDTDAVFTDMVMRLAPGWSAMSAAERRSELREESGLTCGIGPAPRRVWMRCASPGIVDDRAWQIRRIAADVKIPQACLHAGPIRVSTKPREIFAAGACDTPDRGVRERDITAVQRLEDTKQSNTESR